MKEKEIMLGVPEDDTETVELDEHRAILFGIPENAVKVEINATVFEDDQLIHVRKVMNIEDIRAAFRKADDGYIDEDDRFTITDAGKLFFEECEKRR